MKKQIAVLLLSGLLSACSGTPNTEQPPTKHTTYHSTDIGWTMEIPDGWTINSKEELSEREKKGKAIMAESIGNDIDISGLKNLANFQKDKTALFQSSIEPFDTVKDGSWKEHCQLLKELIYDSYTRKGLQVDTTATTIVTVDGLEFERLYSVMHIPGRSVTLKQIMFLRLIKGYAFGANISYIEDADKEIMMQAWMQSRFEK